MDQNAIAKLKQFFDAGEQLLENWSNEIETDKWSEETLITLTRELDSWVKEITERVMKEYDL